MEIKYEKPVILTEEAEIKDTVESADGAFIGTVAITIVASYYSKNC